MIYQIIDKDGLVKLEYTDKEKAKQVLDCINAFSDAVYTLKEIQI